MTTIESGRILSPARIKGLKMMFRGLAASLLGTLVMACSGCGGGGGSSDTAQAAQPTQKTPTPVLIEAYGDSTTQGYTTGIVGPNPRNQVVVLQELLQAKYGTGVTVTNEGIGGTESSQLLYGTDGVHPAWSAQMAKSKAQIVTIEFGLGDNYNFATSTPIAGTEQETPERFAQILTELVTTARASGKQVVLIEPNPSCNPVRQPNQGYYVMQVDAVAKQLGVPLIQHYWPLISQQNWQAQLSDCTHPTTDLYAIEAKQNFDVLAPIVASLQQ